MALPLTRHLFTVDDYYRMAESGVLREDDRVELIDGEIVDMAPIGSGHAGTVDGLGDLLRARIGACVIVRGQNPIRLGVRSEPEPDLAVVTRRDDYYRQSHPTPAEILLLIEVADSSLEYDRQTKAPLYARAGIVELWIVNLLDRVIEVYREPSPDGYLTTQTSQLGDTIQPVSFPELSIAVSDAIG